MTNSKKNRFELEVKDFMLATSADARLYKSICDTLDCGGGIPNAAIPTCGAKDYGQSIVKIFVAKTTSSSFLNTTLLADGSAATGSGSSANWAQRLGYSASGATKDERIVAIGDVHTGRKPNSQPETEESPDGGTQLVSVTHEMTFEIKRWNDALIDSINQLRCLDSVKFWYLTNTGYLFGGVSGFTPANFVWGHLQHNGVGQGSVKSENSASWIDKDQSRPVLAAFLRTATN